MSALLLAAVPLAPLAAAALSLALARRPAWSGALALAANAFSLAALVALRDIDVQMHATWLQAGGLTLTAGLALDPLSRYAALLVAAVALPVNCYALGYMTREPARGFFFAAMSFFLGAMLALVLASSLVLLFAAWEAVGVASFVLIGFRHREREARSAAGQAFLLTRAGDVLLLLGWLLAWRLAGTDDIVQVLARLTSADVPHATMSLVALLILGGAIGKSAQLPLSAWLPAAMAGPTPVSALIHSATMVAAGAYLVLRLYPLFEAAPLALSAVLWIGAASALFGALLATAQADLKRVLAWSTISHLGEMFFALGLAGPLAAAFHLVTHAAYKATLFLAAGAVERGTGMRILERLGGLARKLPIAAASFIAGAAALAGLPPLSGFWSEERILGAAAQRGPAAALFMLVVSALAGAYIGRAAAAVFGRWPGAPAPEANDSPASMKLGMAALAFAAILLGWLLAGPIAQILPFASPPAVALHWRIAAVLSGLAGLAFAVWRVHASGPLPALGVWVLGLERALLALTNAPARMAWLLAARVDAFEKALDATAICAARTAGALAACCARSEAVLDSAGRATGRSVFESARLVDAVELGGFRRPIDRVAAVLGAAGATLRGLETGKLYLYTFAVFVWVVMVLFAAVLLA